MRSRTNIFLLKIAFVCASFFAETVHADWTFMQVIPFSNYKVEEYADISKNNLNQKYRQISLLTNFDRLYEGEYFGLGTKYRSEIKVLEFDCSVRKYRILSWVQYSGFMGSGAKAWADETPSGWKDVWTGSIFGVVSNIGTYYRGLCE